MGEPSDKELDAACRAVVFQRDRSKCVKCSGTSHLQWAHVMSRRYKALRWNPKNSMCLCAGCHLAWHHKPVESALWWVSWAGADTEKFLRATLKAPGKVDRKLTLLWLQSELKRLQRA
jgi:5-methylcytosine-specific restriction endonuclease McrA